jgi:hypothetical protein
MSTCCCCSTVAILGTKRAASSASMITQRSTRHTDGGLEGTAPRSFLQMDGPLPRSAGYTATGRVLFGYYWSCYDERLGVTWGYWGYWGILEVDHTKLTRPTSAPKCENRVHAGFTGGSLGSRELGMRLEKRKKSCVMSKVYSCLALGRKREKTRATRRIIKAKQTMNVATGLSLRTGESGRVARVRERLEDAVCML